MSTSDLRSTGMRLIRNLMTLQTAIDPKPSPSIFQAMSMPVTQPTPSVAQPLPNIPISIVEVIEKENHYLKKLDEVIYRSIVVEMVVDKEHVNNKGTLHGGQTAALVDIVTARAVAVTQRNVPMASTDLSVSYLLPVKIGETIVIEGTVLKAGKTMAFTEIEFRRKSDNALIAKGKHNLAFVQISPEKLNKSEPYY